MYFKITFPPVYHLCFVLRYYGVLRKDQFRGAAAVVVSADSSYPDSIIVAVTHGRKFFNYYFKRLGSAKRVDVIARSGKDLPAMLPKVLKEWREPQHECFEARTGWSLFNAFTETLKGSNPFRLPKRTAALHGLMDARCGVLN